MYYDANCKEVINHAVLIVGYGKTDRGEEYWYAEKLRIPNENELIIFFKGLLKIHGELNGEKVDMQKWQGIKTSVEFQIMPNFQSFRFNRDFCELFSRMYKKGFNLLIFKKT